MRLVALGLLIGLSACNGDKGEGADEDGDGVRVPIDCDDGDPLVFPAQEEICNGVDDDCDQQIDEGVAQPWHPDADGDGFGSKDAAPTMACVAPAGSVADASDCDDSRADVNPEGAEDCSAVDMNCDGDPTEGAVGAWYVDDDGDGYGLPDDTPKTDCDPGEGYAEQGGDCDDDDPDRHPGAVEICNGADDDCNGVDDDGLDSFTTYQDADLDGFGNPATALQTCIVDAGRTLDGTDCDDLDDTSYPGGVELCDAGRDNDCDPLTGDDDAPDAPIWYADDDGDGHGDITRPIQACEPGTAAPFDDDCDDGDPTSFPGNIEFCDGGIDNDCDAATDEAFTAIWYYDQDSDGFGVETDTFTGCSPPADYVQVAGDCDDSDPRLNPTLTPLCIQEHCGTIALSETWRSTVEHRVTCDVVVEGAAKPTLTIADGAVVSFKAGTEMRIGKSSEGKLVVQGEQLGVLFTSSETFPRVGDWDGLVIGSRDRGSVVVGLTVEYGGKNGEGGVTVDGGDPTFDRLTSRLNLNHGLFVSGSEPLIHDSFLIDNTSNGLFVDEGAGLARTPLLGGSGPSFTDNVITGNAGLPITVPGSHADEIDLSNVLVPNEQEEIELLSGTLRFGGTWFDHQIPYRVADNDTIQVEDGPQAVLTIEDGVEIYFGISAGLTVGDGEGGRLVLEDGPEPILFSATQEVIDLSDNWDGVLFGADDDGSEIRNLIVEFGGGNGKGNLYVKGSAPLFDGVISQGSDSAGLYVSGSTAAPEIRNSVFVFNDEDGVFVESTSGIARSLVGPTFASNLLTDNGESSIVIPPGFIGELDPSTQFSGNHKPIQVHPGRVVEDALWRRLDDVYQVLGDIDIGGPQDPVVEIEDGVELRFDRNTEITAGTVDDGALVIDAPVLGVVMTSSDKAPGEGDWKGVKIGRNGALAPQTALRGLTIAYAGGADVDEGGALELLDTSNCSSLEPYVDLDDITILSSSKAGLLAESRTRFSADGFVVRGALGGCFSVSHSSSCPPPEIVSFTHNDCQDGAIFGTWPILRVDKLDLTSTYPGPVLLDGDEVSRDLTIPALPVSFGISEVVEIGGGVSPVLTVAAGARITFGEEAGLEIGNGDPGGLVLEPGVELTSDRSAPSPGDWDGLLFGRDCLSETHLSDVTVSYAGGNDKGAIWLENCELGTFERVSITDSSSCGVYLDPSDLSPPPLIDFVYSGNADGDVCLDQG